MTPSIARRLALLFALAALAVFSVVGVGFFPVLRTQLDAHLRESLYDRAEVAKIIVYHASNLERWHSARERLTEMSPPDSTTVYAVTSADPAFNYGHPIEGQVLHTWPGGYRRIRATPDGQDMLTSTLRLPARGARPEIELQVAASYQPNLQTLHTLRVAFAVLSGLGSLAVLILSYAVTRIGLVPLGRLSKEAAAVSPDNRAQRLNEAALPHELKDLAQSFNGALERLDGAYGRLESFNADVAHELRTPVTILIGQTQVALTRDRSVDELRDTLQSNLEEYERMRGVINDMLFLARADQGELATGRLVVSLAAEVAHTLEFLDIPLDEAGVKAVAVGDAQALVNRSLFGRAFTNLLMNAIQHCQPGDTIAVNVERVGKQVNVAVANPGAPIDPATMDYLFDRFYRAEASRTNSRENHGLGLAIVKAIAEMHRGTVFSTSENGINTFGFSVDASVSNEDSDVASKVSSPSAARRNRTVFNERKT